MYSSLLPSSQGTRGFGQLVCLFLLTIASSLHAKTFEGDITRFSPDVGQPLFPAGNINIFKQYALTMDVSERVGNTVKINLLFTSIEFGGELAGGVNAAIGLEVGLCFGGNADFDLAFKPTVSIPERYPTEFPIQLTVDEGLMPDSHFTTTFPPLGKAYADLIFELGAYLRAKACVFGCFDAIDFNFSTCQLDDYFQRSIRCDPTQLEKAYCSIELASFNRRNNNTFRMLNVAADNRYDFLANPFIEYSLGSGSNGQNFFADPTSDQLQVSSGSSFKNGDQVNLTTSGSLPGGLNSSSTYYINRLSGNNFQLARRAGGAGINITSAGSGTNKIALSETAKPDAPSIGDYGKISISAPTVGTDSRVSSIDDSEKPFTVNPSSDRLIITSLPGLRNGNKVKVSSVGGLPSGLNRSCIYYVNNATAGGLSVQLSTKLGGPIVDIYDFGSGTHRISLQAEFNSTQGLKSTGAEDIMAIDIDVAKLVSDLIFPPSFPSLKDSGSIGPIDWNYTIASLELGPAVQLQTDFEMTWDLRVTEITFRKPGTFQSQTVMLERQLVSALSQVSPARVVYLTNMGPNALPVVVLQDTDEVEVTINYTLEPKLKTVVSTPFLGRVKYAALGAGASVDKVGNLDIGPLIHGEHNFKFGEFEVYGGDPSPIQSSGPRSEFAQSQDLSRYDLRLLDISKEAGPTVGCGEVYILRNYGTLWIRIFDVTGEIVTDKAASAILPSAMYAELQDNLNPWPLSKLTDNEQETILEKATAISSLAPGKIVFNMKAAGPPSFFWRPNTSVNGNNTLNSWNYLDQFGKTNWLEVISIPANQTSFPGEYGNGSDATIDRSPYPTLYYEYGLNSLNVASGFRLDVRAPAPQAEYYAGLTINGGVVQNDGIIYLTNNDANDQYNGSYLRLNAPVGSLTGTGTVNITNGGYLTGPESDTFSFTNYNTISGHGEAMDLYNNYSDSTFNNMGIITGNDSNHNYLISSGHHMINQGNIYSIAPGNMSIKGELLENRKGSQIAAFVAGSSALFRFDEVENAGRAIAGSGGSLQIAPLNFDRTAWNNGLSFNADVGDMIATDAEATLNITNADISGGRIRVDKTGNLYAYNTTFTGSQMIIGEFDPNGIDPNSGLLYFSGNENILTKVILNNYGTVDVHGSVEFENTLAFSNNGSVIVASGALLKINEVFPDITDPNASDVATSFPGTANATGELLVGGTWDISGSLIIEGASFKATGANAARAITSYGSIDGTSNAVSDTAEEDLSRVLSLGAPAHVILRGSSWSFPALDSLLVNNGSFELRGGADFPGGSLRSRTVGDFINSGSLIIDTDSQLKISGSFAQSGAKSSTSILNNGIIFSDTDTYTIAGGSVSVAPQAEFLNVNGSGFLSGTSIYITSPLIDDNQLDIYGNPSTTQEIVSIDFDASVQIDNIGTNVDLTLHGSAIQFYALTAYLNFNSGRFTVDGDGIDNPGQVRLPSLTNTGEFNIFGLNTLVKTNGDFIQYGANAVTRIGAGASITSLGGFTVNAGKIIIDVDSRPKEQRTHMNGTLAVNRPPLNFGDGLVINFTGRLALTIPDVGDTWAIYSNKISTEILGYQSATFTLNDGPIPAGWLPAGTHLEMIQFDTSFGKRGLGVRIIPDNGFYDYESWAANYGLNRSSPQSDPLEDANFDGVVNAMEYLFGPNNGDGSFPGQQQTQLVNENGQTFYEISYLRPSFVDAVYTAYYSLNLEKWYLTSMDIVDVSPVGNGLERVTMRSTFAVSPPPVSNQPAEDPQTIFYRIRGFLNVDNFDIGILTEEPINHGSVLNNFEQTLRNSLGQDVSYTIEPGRVLYFNVNADARGSSIYGGTAANGVDRNYIYRDLSALQVAVVHAGILDHGQNGTVKVTFVETPSEGFTSSTQNYNTPSQVTSQNSSDTSGPYAYRVDPVK